MIHKLIYAAILCLFSAGAFASNIPGESAYCLAHCINGLCNPVVVPLGAQNYSIGLPLGVPFVTQIGTRIAPATSYAWNWTGGPFNTPTNLTGISTDIGNAYVIGKVTMSDSGLYAETGYANLQPGDISGGTETINWCITVNPIAVLSNN